MSDSSFHVESDISGFQSKETMKNIVKRRMTFQSTMLFVLVVLVIIVAVGDTYISGELDYQKRLDEKRPTNISTTNFTTEPYVLSPDMIYIFSMLELVLKSLITFLTLLTCVTLYIYYNGIFKLNVLQNYYPPTMSFYGTPSLLKVFVVEVIVCVLHLPPLVTNYIGISYRFQIIVFLRLYLTGRFLKHKHELMNSKSTRFLASVTKTELSSLFLSKTFFMQYPFHIIFYGYILILFLGGYAMWLIEEKRYSYLETLWMIAITMTTVGFGDYTPKTFLGRTVIGFTSMIGIFIMALFVSLVNEVLSLRQKEKRILTYVETQEAIRQRKIIALNAIGTWYKYYSYQRKKRYIMNSPSQCLVPSTKRQLQMHILSRFKGYALELKMIKAINLWRKSKEGNVNRNFNHEFMIEDIKIMLSGLVPKVEYLMDKVSDEDDKNTRSEKSSLNQSTRSLDIIRSVNSSGIMMNEVKHPNNEKGKRRKSNATIESQDEMIFCERNNNCETAPNFTLDRESDTRIFGKKCETIRLHEVIVKEAGKNHRRWNSNQTMNMTLELLQNQTIIMNNNLNDSYRKSKEEISNLQKMINVMNNNVENLYVKTKQDLYDLQNIIRSLQFCCERELKANNVNEDMV